MSLISFSAISTYRDCPYAYKLKYIDRCEPMFYDDNIFFVGNIVHEAIHSYYAYCYSPSYTKDEIFDITYSYMKEHWDFSVPTNLYMRSYQCLQNFSGWEENNTSKPLSEKKLQTDMLYGIVDYIDLDNNVVVDFKTSSSSYLSFNNRLQAQIYKELIEKNFNCKIEKLHFFFLYNNRMRTVSFDNPKQEAFKDIVYTYVKNIHKHIYDKSPRLPSTCKSCPFAYYCKVLGI